MLPLCFHRSACLLKAVEFHAAGEEVVRHQKPCNSMHRSVGEEQAFGHLGFIIFNQWERYGDSFEPLSVCALSATVSMLQGMLLVGKLCTREPANVSCVTSIGPKRSVAHPIRKPRSCP